LHRLVSFRVSLQPLVSSVAAGLVVFALGYTLLSSKTVKEKNKEKRKRAQRMDDSDLYDSTGVGRIFPPSVG
jgi:hypothetical protein